MGVSLLFATQNARAAATEVDVSTPSFSFDSKKLAYSVCTYTQQGGKFNILSSEVWTANRDGSGARRLTSGKRDGDTHWSPDGKHIAFRRNGDIWMVGADGTDLKQITKTDPAEESSPEFSNDGKTLFFVRTNYINLMQFTPGAKPLLAPEPGVVVAYNLGSGQEKEYFKSKNSIKYMAPNRADANEVFLLYTNYEVPGQTGDGDLVVAAAKLDGTAKRVLKTQKKYARPSLEGIYPHSAGVVIETEELNTEFKPVRRFLVQSKSGDKTFTADDLPLMTFNHISLDGKLVAGTGPITKRIDGELYVESSIKIYDLVNEKTVGLDRKMLLGLATTPVVAPPRPDVAPVTPATATQKTNPALPPLPIPTKVRAEPPAAAKAHFDEGYKDLLRGAFASGRDEFSKAIELYPGYVEAYANRAVCYRREGQLKEALDDLNTVIRLAPTDIYGYFRRGEYHLRLGDYPAARADYDTAIQVAPKSAIPYYERAMFFGVIGDKQRAAEDDQKGKELQNAPK